MRFADVQFADVYRSPSVWVGRIWLLALAAFIAMFAVAVYSDTFLPVAAVLLAIAIAGIAPLFTTVCCVSWILLVRPNSKLVQLTFGGFNVTEVDFLVLLALVSACQIRPAARLHDVRSKAGDWWPLLAWPVWIIVRALLPPLGEVGFGSSLVDLRILSAYVLIVPFWLICSRVGMDALLRLLCYVAYASCTIAIAAWALARIGIMPRGSFPLVNLAPGLAQDVRPGAEILIPILAVFLVAGTAPLLLKSRILSFGVLLGEILVSQTLSIALAAAVGVCSVLILDWRKISFGRRALILSAITASAMIALSGSSAYSTGDGDTGSRFNLSQRVSENSAQYRVNEADTIYQVVVRNPDVLAIGTGPGSLVTFNDGLVNKVKDLTHNVYNNVLLKTGLIGLFLFSWGWIILSRRLFASNITVRRPLIGCIISIAMLSVTVPFASTVSGLAGLLGLGTLAVGYSVQNRSRAEVSVA